MISLTFPACAAAGAGSAAKPTVSAAAPEMAISSLVMLSGVLSSVSAGEGSRGSLDSLRQFDGYPETSPDARRQEGIASGVGRAGRAGAIAMLELVGTKIPDIGGQFGIVVSEIAQLLAVMPVDLGLDRVGASKRSLLRHQRGGRAKREP